MEQVRIATITKEWTFDAGHMLLNHTGKCSRPHGHTYRVVVSVCGVVQKELGGSSEGMVLDFGDLSKIVKPILDELDHRFLVKGDEWIYITCKEYYDSLGVDVIDDFVVLGFRPTAENLATYLTDKIAACLKDNIDLGHIEVTVYETPTSSARVWKEVD